MACVCILFIYLFIFLVKNGDIFIVQTKRVFVGIRMCDKMDSI